MTTEPKIGDRVKATIRGEVWFTGIFEQFGDAIIPYGIRIDNTNVLMYFATVEKVEKVKGGRIFTNMGIGNNPTFPKI